MEVISLTELTESPIPQLPPVTGWKEKEIHECGESLVKLNDLDTNLLVIDAQYYQRGIKFASPELFARESVAEMLLGAARLLPPSHELLIWDAWRPIEVQQALFDSYLQKLVQKHPNMAQKQLLELAQTYVSLPSADPLKPSPHYTGGAIDLSILGFDGNPLDMGTEFDHFGSEAAMRFYEDRALKTQEILARNNRRLLYQIMTMSGFSSYDEEWWHFDFGNQFHAAKTGESAIYVGTKPT